MRQNFPGLLAWALLLVGLATGGVWLVIMGTSGAAGAVGWGIAALVCLIASLVMLLVIRYVLRNDPVEPEVTRAEEQAYLRRRRLKRRRDEDPSTDSEPV